MQKQAVLSLSGGMDSSTLLLHLLAEGYQVTALSFNYGQKHKVELERAKELVEYVNSNAQGKRTSEFGNFDEKYEKFPKVNHQIIKFCGLQSLLSSNLVEGGNEVPEGHYEQENMKETVVPNRNKMFSSVIQAVALSIANQTKEDVIIALGIHAGDHAIYPDCRQEFRDADFEAFRIGNWGSEKVSYYTPYLKDNKYSILLDGEKCCVKLGVDFDEVYKRTNTSYKPIEVIEQVILTGASITTNGDIVTEAKVGKVNWYSDYKSASSVERIEAFFKLGRPDPVAYADETGPVEWEVAATHVEKLLAEHSKTQTVS